MEELIDVLNENGIKTGEVLTRKEVHRLGLWHRIIVVAIIDEKNQVLMQQRSFKKDTNPGKWDISVAGHVSSGQTATEAAIREIEEEVGLIIQKDNLKHVLTYKKESNVKKDYLDKQIYDCYIAKVKKINVDDIVIQESEVEAVKLVTKDEFKEIILSENVVERPELYQELIKYLF